MGAGWEILRAYCSNSKFLGKGDVWICVQCVIYKSDCTVLYCCVGKCYVCIFSIKHSGF